MGSEVHLTIRRTVGSVPRFVLRGRAGDWGDGDESWWDLADGSPPYFQSQFAREEREGMEGREFAGRHVWIVEGG